MEFLSWQLVFYCLQTIFISCTYSSQAQTTFVFCCSQFQRHKNNPLMFQQRQNGRCFDLKLVLQIVLWPKLDASFEKVAQSLTNFPKTKVEWYFLSFPIIYSKLATFSTLFYSQLSLPIFASFTKESQHHGTKCLILTAGAVLPQPDNSMSCFCPSPTYLAQYMLTPARH